MHGKQVSTSTTLIRSIVSIIGAGFMSAILGPFLGPFMAIWGGLLAHVMAMGTPMIGDRSAEERDAEEEAWYVLKLKAVGIAVEVTKEHITRETWNRISEEVQDTIQRVIRTHDDPGSLRAAWPIMFDTIMDTIRKVDYDVYRNFLEVYQAACDELGV